MKFIHCADLHLDSPLLGLARIPDAPAEDIRLATRRAFEHLVLRAREEQVDFVLIAGDIYDTGLQALGARAFDPALFFNRQMAELKKDDIRVYLIYGNHDAASKLEHNLYLPDNVKVFSHKQAETVLEKDLAVAIHGLSFATGAITENMVLHYPEPVDGMFNIGMLHTSLTGAVEHDNYAPCTANDLTNLGYDYWALGHVHQRRVVSESGPRIVYPGNTQGRHFREIGEKSCELVTVTDQKVASRTIRTAVLPWFHLALDLSECDDGPAAFAMIRTALEQVLAEADGRTAAVRIQVFGQTGAYGDLARDEPRTRAEIFSIARELADDQIWLAGVRLECRPQVDLDQLAKRQDPLGQVLRLARDPGPQSLAPVVADLAKRLPRQLQSGPEPLDLSDSGLRKRLPEVERMLALMMAEAGA